MTITKISKSATTTLIQTTDEMFLIAKTLKGAYEVYRDGSFTGYVFRSHKKALEHIENNY